MQTPVVDLVKEASMRIDVLMRRIPVMKLMGKLWFVPPLLPFRYRRSAPVRGPWDAPHLQVPPALRSVPGIRRDATAEENADLSDPIRDWQQMYPATLDKIFRYGWMHFLAIAPRRGRALRKLKAVEQSPIANCRSTESGPQELTDAVKKRAADVGVSAIGIAAYDPKYTYTEFRGPAVGDKVVVCVLEANREAIQTAPSSLAEKAQMGASTGLIQMLIPLEGFLRSRGYDVRMTTNEGIALHYAVQSGLGQLGLNGQLLTPQAGSRVRVLTFVTNAPLIVDDPIDYGIAKVCDSCHICVRRCPSGAITSVRRLHRGVYKAKVNLARCAPVVTQAHGCAICTKTCPIQRFGLKAVIEEWERTRTVLGKDTDDLEGYEFEGTYYAVGERPKLKSAFFEAIPVRIVEHVKSDESVGGSGVNL